MGQKKFMNSTKPSIHRLFSHQDFAESLQVLNQLSTQETDTQSTEAIDPYCDISWDDAAADVENFLAHSDHSSTSAKSN